MILSRFEKYCNQTIEDKCGCHLGLSQVWSGLLVRFHFIIEKAITKITTNFICGYKICFLCMKQKKLIFWTNLDSNVNGMLWSQTFLRRIMELTCIYSSGFVSEPRTHSSQLPTTSNRGHEFSLIHWFPNRSQ